ncbi:hypothetical protein [Streptomyces niveus]|uniref:hypothetical protein n=1 Tax=Streptomyces niveus TaxID=193462 RepID=UPI0033F1D7CB
MSIREEVLTPFRGLPRDIRCGSPVLLRHITRGLRAALRAALRALRGTGSTVPAPASPPSAEAAGQVPHERAKEDSPKEQAPQVPASRPWAKGKQTPAAPGSGPAAAGEGGVADLAEAVVVGFLCLALAVTFLGMVLGFLGRILAPYRWGVGFILAVAWCIAAAIAAPQGASARASAEATREDTITNDHEMLAGEEPPAPSTPWEAVREFVEGAVAAGAAGFADAKGRGARVDDLLLGLQGKGLAGAGWDRKAAIVFLESAGITVREQMKFRLAGRQKNHPGVHIDDLADDLGHRPRLPAHLVPDITPQPTPRNAPPTTR